MSGWRNWKGPKDPILEDGKTIPYEDCEEILTYESNVTQNLDEKTQYEKFQEAFCQLSIRESTVILARFWEKLNLEEVGKVLGGISKERVRQIEAKALRKLRHPIRMQIYFCPFEYKLYQAEMQRIEEIEQKRERVLHSKWRLIQEEKENKRRETRNRNLKERAERNSVEARKKSEQENKDAIERHQAMEEKKAKEDYYNSPEAVKERVEEERERNMHKIATARAAATRLAEQQQIVRENMMENLSMKNGTVCCRPTQMERLMNDEIPAGYVRVTELLAPYNGLQGIDPLVLAKAADRGKRAHGYCELYAQSLLIGEIDEDCKGFIKSFKGWFDNVVEEVVSLEERLFDEEHKITGKYDLIVKMKGSKDHVLIDIKTPQNASKTWPLQTAAYMWMLNRKHLQRVVQRRGCLMIDRTGNPASFKEHGSNPRDDIRDRSVFLGIVQLYRYFNG